MSTLKNFMSPSILVTIPMTKSKNLMRDSPYSRRTQSAQSMQSLLKQSGCIYMMCGPAPYFSFTLTIGMNFPLIEILLSTFFELLHHPHLAIKYDCDSQE